MAKYKDPNKPFELEYLLPLPPTGRSKRWKPKPVHVGPYPTQKAAGAALVAHETLHGPQVGWRIHHNGRAVYTWVDFHGPLGWMARGYMKVGTRHPNDCPRCEEIARVSAQIYGGRKAALKMLISGAITWEQKEAMGRNAPFPPRTRAKYAAEGWVGPF
jgi:hypothetical protein